MSLEIDLYTLLSTDASIAAATSTGASPAVYLVAIPKGLPDTNAIVIQCTETTRSKGYDVTNQLTFKRIQFDCYSDKASVAQALGNAVLNLLKDMIGTLASVNITGVIPDKDLDMGEEPGDGGMVFRRMLDFDFQYNDLPGQAGVPFVAVAAPAPGSNAAYLEGVPVDVTTPTSGQALVYDAATGKWKPGNVAGGGANFADDETPAGAINGTNGSDGNAVFTLAHAPIANPILAKNGQIMVQGVAYTLAGNTITFIAPYIPITGDVLTAWYRF